MTERRQPTITAGTLENLTPAPRADALMWAIEHALADVRSEQGMADDNADAAAVLQAELTVDMDDGTANVLLTLVGNLTLAARQPLRVDKWWPKLCDAIHELAYGHALFHRSLDRIAADLPALVKLRSAVVYAQGDSDAVRRVRREAATQAINNARAALRFITDEDSDEPLELPAGDVDWSAGRSGYARQAADHMTKED